jgi:phytoene dehydrogenase-like protein
MVATKSASAQEAGKRGTPPVDAIFVGAGINALAGAFLLGRAGWRVLVVDRNDEPGGAIRTLELTLPGFRHDIGAMNLGLFANSPFFQQHQDALAKKGLGFVVADRSAGSVFPGDRFLGITTDPAETLRAIARFSKADAEAWKAWRADFDACAPFLFQIFGSPAPSARPLAYVFGDNTDVPEAVQPVLRGILLESLRANLTARFESQALPAVIAAWGLHPDYAPDIAGGCVYPFLETNIDARQGISIVKGGSGRLIGALVELIRDAGGELRSAAPVEKIVIEKGRAVGIALTGGEVIRASRAVVASVTPRALLDLVDGQLPRLEAQQAGHWRHGPGTMMIHLALSDLPDWRAKDARRSFYVHISPSLDDLARAYQEGLAGLLSAEPFCVVAQPTLYDPSRAPAGKHVLWIMVRCVPAVIRGDAAGKIEGRAWTREITEAFADRVLDLIEGYAPGLREKILAKAIHSPKDLEDLNPNLVGGDINAGSCHLDQFYGQRPFSRYAHHKMPIPGLYMCGASTWPGAGAGTGSGGFVAQQILADNP